MLFSLSLLGTAFIMGVTGGPHCLAMCAAPCAVVTGASTASHSPPASVASAKSIPIQAAPSGVQRWLGPVSFHAGRIAGYSLMGALAAMAMQSLAWFSDRTSWLHPLWVGMHLAVLFWGGWMLLLGQQPQWLDGAGRAMWRVVRPLVQRPGGTFVAGMAWALLPCGLLYSALMVAALSGGAVQGAVSMTLFAVGSGLWLWLAPLAWYWLRRAGMQHSPQRGTRLAGALLVLVGIAALWMDLVHTPAMWCR